MYHKKEFLCTLHRIIDKINSIWIQGKVSSGKNFFFDIVCNPLFNVGYVTNPIRHYIFSFMDCVVCRILLWNEEQCDSYFYENTNAIHGGDCPKVNIKNLGPCTVAKIHVVVLSNHCTFLNNNEFNTKIEKYICGVMRFVTEVSF